MTLQQLADDLQQKTIEAARLDAEYRAAHASLRALGARSAAAMNAACRAREDLLAFIEQRDSAAEWLYPLTSATPAAPRIES